MKWSQLLLAVFLELRYREALAYGRLLDCQYHRHQFARHIVRYCAINRE